MLPKPFIKLVEFRLTIPILVTYTREHPAMMEKKTLASKMCLL